MTNIDVLPRLAELCEKLDRLLQNGRASHVRFLSVNGAAQYSGLSTKSIRRLIALGRITALHPVRGRVVIDRNELDSFILASGNSPRGGRGRR